MTRSIEKAGLAATLVALGIGAGLTSSSATLASEAPVDIPTTDVAHQIELVAVADADVQGGAPDANYGGHTLMHVGNDDKTAFLTFDLSSIPPNATIKRARLVMTVAGSGNSPNEVKLGAVKQAWDESAVTFANQPDVAWSKRTQNIAGAGPVTWGVKGPVSKWLAGNRANNGFAIRSTGPGDIWAFVAREGAPEQSRPRLRVEYTTTGGVIEPPRVSRISQRSQRR